MARDYQPIRRHSSRLSQAAEGAFITTDQARRTWLESGAAKSGVSAEDYLAAQASGVHLASDDYPEMGDVLRDRPDPGSVITVVGALQGPLTASAAYGRPDDARDEEYDGGPQDTGTYWAEPGQQEWKEEHLGPQEAAPPPPWAPAVMEAEMSPAMARLAQIEEARQFFGAPVPGTAPLRHSATTVNGTQIDDHGDAPGHGTVPRASAPDAYDDRSTEGDGDPKWSDPVDKKDTDLYNGATVGMYPEGMSAGGGPGLEIGAYVAHNYRQPGQHELEQHLTGEHGVSPADLSALRMRAWQTYPGELEAAHQRVSQGRPLDDWYGEAVTAHGRPMSHTDIQDHLYRQHGVMMAGGHSPGELEAAHQGEHANLDFPPGEHHGPAGRPETEAPDEYGPDQGDAATYSAHAGPLDPVFGSRVPWTGAERGSLHRWQDVPTGTWGDFVPSGEFIGRGARQSPVAQEEREEERAREMSAEAAGTRYEPFDAGNPGWQGVADHHPGREGFDPGEAEEPDYAKDLDVYTGLAAPWHHWDRTEGHDVPGWFDHTLSRLAALGPDPAEEARARDHLLNHHGWDEGSVSRAEARGDRLSHVHEALHDAGLANHDRQDPAGQRELSERFGDPYRADSRRGQGGMPLHTWSTRTSALDPPHPHDDEFSSLDSGPSEGDEGFPELHDDLQSPDEWPLAQAGAPRGPAYTQGSQDGHGGRVFPPPPPMPAPAGGSEGLPGEEAGEEGDGKKVKIEVKAHLGAFTAAAADPRFRFEFTASWPDVVAKARRIRREGHVRITHASAGMVIGEVRGDHDTYESGIQRPPGKPQTIQHWACGCPWASFHQDKSLGTRYAGRPCSHVMALQYEAQARGMFGKAVARDEAAPAWSRRDVTVKSWPPYEGEPHAGRWADTWLAPSASLHRMATPDEARDRDWTPEERDEWDRGNATAAPGDGQGLTPEEREVLQAEEEQDEAQDGTDPDDGDGGCYYGRPHECPQPGLRSTAESLRYPRPDGFRSEITPNPAHRPAGAATPEEAASHVLTGYVGKYESGRLHFSQSDGGHAIDVHMLHTFPGYPKVRGLGSAMMDDLYAHARASDAFVNHGYRTREGNNWWSGYQEPHPELNTHHLHPDAGWHHYWSPAQVASDMQDNARNSRGRGAHTPLQFDPAQYAPGSRDEAWTQARGTSPARQATAALLAAGEDPGELIALAWLGGLSALVRTADQANAPWGSENVSKHPPVKPYGATEPPNRDQSPASYGFLSAPDPDNWGGIQDDSAMQMPLSNTAVHQVLAPTAPGPLPAHLNYPDVGDFREDRESFGYADRASAAGPSTSLTPRDPGGIRMEEARNEAVVPDWVRSQWRAGGKCERCGESADTTYAGTGEEMCWGCQQKQAEKYHQREGARATDPGRCPCCGGAGEHGTGRECYGCDASGSAGGYGGPVPCEGTMPYGTDSHGHQVELHPMDGWQHLDGSVSEDDGSSVTDHPVRAELRDDPEPALPSTTGEDPQGEGEGLRQLAGADGTMGDAQDVPHQFTASRLHGGCALCGLASGKPPHPAGLSDTGAGAELSGVVCQRPGASGIVREEFRRKFGGTPMGDLARETSPQAQQPSQVGQEPGAGSMDELLSPDNPSVQTIGQRRTTGQQWSGGGADSDELAVPPGEAQGSIDDIVASFQRSAAARQFGAGTSSTMEAGDIAGAARQYLSKTADVLPDAEAAELIAEGRGQRARNLGLLRLEGTHYADEEDDLSRRGISLDDYDDDVISV